MTATFCASPPASATLALTTRRMIKRRSPEHSRLVIIVALGGGGSWGDCVPSPAKAARPTTAPETSHCLSFPDELGNALQPWWSNPASACSKEGRKKPHSHGPSGVNPAKPGGTHKGGPDSTQPGPAES